jgi:hypothetical protein
VCTVAAVSYTAAEATIILQEEGRLVTRVGAATAGAPTFVGFAPVRVERLGRVAPVARCEVERRDRGVCAAASRLDGIA